MNRFFNGNGLFAFILLFTSCLVQANKTVEIPLAYATDNQGDIVLRGQNQTISIPISILDGQEVEEIALSLSISNNNDIDQTLLWVAAGNKTLANIELKQRSQRQNIRIKIPPALISQENPHLILRVQHLLKDAKATVNSTSLSTLVSGEHSFYSLMYSESASLESQTLMSFDEMVQSDQNYNSKVYLVSLIDRNPTLALGAAASIVQGWALRSGSEDHQFDYRSEGISGTQRTIRTELTGPTVVFGNKEALIEQGWIDNTIYQSITGPYLGTGLSKTGIEWLLVVSGNSDLDVKRAAHAFANNTRDLPDTRHMVIQKIESAQDRFLKSDETYRLSEFTNQSDLTHSPLELRLVMPSNILFGTEDTAKINLLLAHTRVAPGEGSMILRVNDKFISSMTLRSSYWRDSQHYRLNIPMRDFKPGINKVSVEVYGPIDIRSQQRRFTATMSEKSNVKLGSWVHFIPTENHQVAPTDFLALTDNNGKSAQITVDKSDPIQMNNLWRLLSYVSHRTQQTASDLLITDTEKQQREFQVMLRQPQKNSEQSIQEEGRLAEVKQQLFDYVAHEQKIANEERQEQQESEYAVVESPFEFEAEKRAFVKHNNGNGWYRIQLLESTESQFDEFLKSEPTQTPSGLLSERDFSRSIHQFIKAIFIGYPIGLALAALFIIWCMSSIVTRYLEERKCG
ncbi:hypothetical protein CW749_01645 [Vibrio sp. vnigr-6D03]|uniref:cellulose biosynthesis cyclic di-GMP-binding regulatory protein BcsB n=1 Tax=Vibrio sp. vnigr-6D03 TaxID=2058088 RepID=UPI000C3323CD|nr:cellulose biosynthesis cyclic di-GMP-binding regulatory protein BcsB [Vibrio sp. vnigr-6D03]PKF81370.1 hypothetical protein CW749_01645 [Vibrio sp. vnigr-6D03]